MRTSRWSSYMLLICLVGARVSVAASQTSSTASTKQAQARRLTASPPTVDGSLDEDVWKTAPWFSDFVQKEPVEGGDPQERTEVGFLYDADALYVGARMWRSPTGELPHPVTRRDQFSNAEQLIISLDTYHDHRTGFTFCISSGGVRSDYYHPGDAEDYRDYGFDPVWEARVTLDSIGWTAEMRIPFSQLRFNSRQEQVWGLNINRWMPGSNQDIYWVMIPKQETGYFSRIGQLVGIEGIRPSRRLEVLPYVAADARYTSNTDPADPFNDGSDYVGRAGADVKMGLGPNLTLDGTVNPDFGQVDADPAVVNLTAYEIFFPERRPFFTEGNNLLRGNGPGYYYSRRIGAPPHGDPGGDFINTPDNTTIIGAGKITGRTAKGLSVGSLFAVTANEYADTFDTVGTVKGHSRVEPLTSFGVARVQQEFGPSASTIGVTLTGVERDLGEDILDSVLSRRAYSGGVDWNLRFQGGTYELSGYGGFSYVAGDSTRIADVQQASARYFQRPDATHVKFDPSRTSLAGYTAGLGFSKLGGKHWVYDLFASAESPEFELNDAGQLSAADDIDVDWSLRYREIQPGKLFHRYNVGMFGHVNWNYGGERQFTRFAVSSSQTWKRFQQTFIGAYLLPRFSSDVLTRGGPLMGSPTAWGTDLEFFSGEAGDFQWRVNGNLQGDEFDGKHLQIGGGVSLRPAPQWFLSLDPRYERTRDERQYLDTQPGGSSATYGQRYIFAALDQTTISAQLRLNYIITPNLSIEGYLEPFASSGAYTRLGELPEPQSTTLRRYGTDGTTIERFAPDSIVITDNGGADSLTLSDPDFNVLSFRSNLVLRWEWRPGSTLFLVWQQSRGSEVTSSHRVTLDDMWDSFGTEGDNFFALKITYWLGYWLNLPVMFVSVTRPYDDSFRPTRRITYSITKPGEGTGSPIPRDILALVRKALEGTYEVDREIGRGGAARVFYATDPSGKPVALKVLHPELLVSVAADRFLREIALVRQLDHPHIGRLLDSGDRDWLVYYVMPYIEGPTLKQLLARDRLLDPQATRRLARDLLGALGHAHKAGIVHRDVKPDNIVLGPDGAVLVDFGIARAVQLSGSDRVTRSGIAVGTSAYMSPEQIGAVDDIDHRTDLYAMGCLLFECLVSRPPYVHKNENVVLQMHRLDPVPDLKTFREDAPEDLVRMITRALAKNREDRWSGAGEMVRVMVE